MMKHLVFLGQGVEYVFPEIAELSRQRGFPVTEIDLLDPNWPGKMENIAPGEFVLITSHHPFLGAAEYAQFHKLAAPVVSVPEFLSAYQPQRAYFVPHDLTIPYKVEEFSALKYFDAVLMINDRYWFLNQFTRVMPMGWIKFNQALDATEPSHDFALVPSEIPKLLNLGRDALIALFGAVLERKPLVLLPRFGEIAKLVSLAEEYGATVADWGTPTSRVIACARLVVTNGTSSVAAEALAHRRPTICLNDGIIPAEMQCEYLGELPGVFIGSTEEGLAWADRLLADPAEYAMTCSGIDVAPFDVEAFFALMDEP